MRKKGIFIRTLFNLTLDVYIAEKNACPCGPLIKVGRVEENGANHCF